jgi:CRP/FNR family transcriptional regulator
MTESILQKFELFKLFKTEELTVLEKALFIQNLKSDQILFSEGQKPEYFYLLIEGKAHILGSAYDGKEVIIDTMGPGEAIGVVALLNHFPFPATCIMTEDSKVARIPEQVFKDFLSQNPLFHQNLMQMVSKRLRHSHEKMRSLSNDPVEQRLAKVVLHETGQGKNNLLALTRQNIADMAGTTVETTIRIMKTWEQKKWVTFPGRGKIEVKKPEALKNLF